MEESSIHIIREDKTVDYRIVDKETDKCEFEIYLADVLMAVLSPDKRIHPRLCNPGGLDEELIVQIADRIQAHYL